jgi:cell division protein FtsB
MTSTLAEKMDRTVEYIDQLEAEIAALKAERDELRKEIARLHEEWKVWKTIFDDGVVVLKNEVGELRAELKVWNSRDEMIIKKG